MELETIRGAKFANETVHVDGKQFVDCEFSHCSLVYSGGEPFNFVQTELQDAQITFTGPAENTLNTLCALHHFGMDKFVEDIIEKIRNPFGGGVQ